MYTCICRTRPAGAADAMEQRVASVGALGTDPGVLRRRTITSIPGGSGSLWESGTMSQPSSEGGRYLDVHPLRAWQTTLGGAVIFLSSEH